MTSDTTARYRAFISYSHADAGLGRRLHRQLEAYALPGRLVGRATPRGPVPRRLAPIFRDREELPAAHDLSAEVRAALAQSGALVVVCSPRAAASPWVGREVALFRELHPDRPVLCALVDGEPAQAFPEILRADGTEPLAADFREGRDGPKLALLKLVAGIVGVGLDELIQRDAQRRLQRVMGVTAASVAAMVAMGVLTLFALNARAEAEHQRKEAEGLVEFMITDLREKLEGVGRVDLMDSVNEKALSYYDGDLSRLPEASLDRRSKVLHLKGEDAETRGDLVGALRAFREARRTTAALLTAKPDDPERIFTHSQSEYWVAFIDWRAGRADAAEAGFQRYANLVARLVAKAPQNAEWQMEAGHANINLGMVALRAKGDAKAADRRFASALTHFRAAMAGNPNDPQRLPDLADVHAWIADSQIALGQYDRARASRLEELRILEILRSLDPKNAKYARDLLGNSLGLAKIDLAQGRASDARRRLKETYERSSELAAADPKNEKVAKQRMALGLFLSKALLTTGAPPSEAEAFTADCRLAIAQGDEELRDLCALTRARVARAQGRRSGPEFDYLRLNRKRLTGEHRSPRWGIDFSRELADVA